MRDLNLSSRFERPSILKLCKEFYDPLFTPNIDIESIKDIDFENIGNWSSEEIPSETSYSCLAIINILRYMYCSYKSYSDLTSANRNEQPLSSMPTLSDYIKFTTYENEVYQIALDELKEQFSHLSSIDLYYDSIVMPGSASYPLQHMNIFFCNKTLSLTEKREKSSVFFSESEWSLKKLTKILNAHGLSEFKFNVLKKEKLDTQATYLIPKQSVFSLTFVLSAFKNPGIPEEYKYMILSDFIINVCIADGRKPYEIVQYLINVKRTFPLRELLESRRELLTNFHKKVCKKISLISAELTDDSPQSNDKVNLFLEFSTEYLQLLEFYSGLSRSMKTFREIEKRILAKPTSELADILNADDRRAEPEITYTKDFLNQFKYDINKKNRISSLDLYDYLTSEDPPIIIKYDLLNTLSSFYLKDEPFDKLDPFYFNDTF